jgi:ketosteroid isomerase-like protein
LPLLIPLGVRSQTSFLAGYFGDMSQASLEVVRSIYSSWERGDFSSAAWADPKVDYVMAVGPAPGRWRGLAGMAHAWRDFLMRTESATLFHLRDGKVVRLVVYRERERAFADLGLAPGAGTP